MQTQQNNKVDNLVGCLYKLDFPNGKSYIGITSKTATKRFIDHCKKPGKRKPTAIKLAINKYGKDSVNISTLAVGGYEYIKNLEKSAIKSYKTKSPYGYNITDGGDGVCGLNVSSETRYKLRVANLGKKRPDHVIAKIAAGSKGRQVKQETRKKISETLTGHVVTEATREKLRAASLGKKQTPESIAKMISTRIGVPRSEEVKAKIGAKNKGRVMSLEQRKFLSDLAKSKWELIRAMGENRPSGKGFTGFKQSQGVS